MKNYDSPKILECLIFQNRYVLSCWCCHPIFSFPFIHYRTEWKPFPCEPHELSVTMSHIVSWKNRNSTRFPSTRGTRSNSNPTPKSRTARIRILTQARKRGQRVRAQHTQHPTRPPQTLPDRSIDRLRRTQCHDAPAKRSKPQTPASRAAPAAER